MDLFVCVSEDLGEGEGSDVHELSCYHKSRHLMDTWYLFFYVSNLPDYTSNIYPNIYLYNIINS